MGGGLPKHRVDPYGFVSSLRSPLPFSLLAEVRSLRIWLRRRWGSGARGRGVLGCGALVFGSALWWGGGLWRGSTADGALLVYGGAQHLFAVVADL